MSEQVLVDDLRIPIRRSARRQTIGITVDRYGDVFVAAPDACGMNRIEDVVQQKRLWIYTKLMEKDQLSTEPLPKRFVEGASFHYLGRAYRMKLASAESCESKPAVRLWQGRFHVDEGRATEAPKAFIHWYSGHGRKWVDEFVRQYSKRLEVQPDRVDIRELGFRWGSCSPAGRVLISWRTIQLPIHIIEYVVVHELAHLLVSNHSAAFWTNLERVMPDYEDRRIWLARNGERFAAHFGKEEA